MARGSREPERRTSVTPVRGNLGTEPTLRPHGALTLSVEVHV
jgi:hypothetical protein